MSSLSRSHRILVLLAALAAVIVAMLLIPAIPQPQSYHDFADKRAILGVPNFGDVASNLAYALAGLWGLAALLSRSGRNLFDATRDAWPYLIFFSAVLLVTFGSGYYHLAPDNGRLFWDRLPITVGFMALFAGFVADRLDRRDTLAWLLPLTMVLGIAALLHWQWSEIRGVSDLRVYILVQLLPLAGMPLIHLLFPRGRYTAGSYIWWMVGLYGAAKAMELFDGAVFGLLDHALSGHSLKHLLSAAAVPVVLAMLRGNASARSAHMAGQPV